MLYTPSPATVIHLMLSLWSCHPQYFYVMRIAAVGTPGKLTSFSVMTSSSAMVAHPLVVTTSSATVAYPLMVTHLQWMSWAMGMSSGLVMTNPFHHYRCPGPRPTWELFSSQSTVSLSLVALNIEAEELHTWSPGSGSLC